MKSPAGLWGTKAKTMPEPQLMVKPTLFVIWKNQNQTKRISLKKKKSPSGRGILKETIIHP